MRRTVVVDGARTSYLDAGAGSPLLLLHGGEFGGGAEVGWERVIPGLAEQHRLTALYRYLTTAIAAVPGAGQGGTAPVLRQVKAAVTHYPRRRAPPASSPRRPC